MHSSVQILFGNRGWPDTPHVNFAAQATTAGDGAITELQTTPQRPLDMKLSFPVAMARHKGAECMTGHGT